MRGAHPGADFLIHPECGCSTSVMEYVAAGDVDPDGVHMLSTGGMLGYASTAPAGATAIVATETGMLHPLREARPDVDFVAANEAASCRFMKMITLPKLRDALREMAPVVKVPGGDRRARAAADRAHGRDRLTERRGAAGAAPRSPLPKSPAATASAARRRSRRPRRRSPSSSASSTLVPATSASVPQCSFSSSPPWSSCSPSSSPWRPSCARRRDVAVVVLVVVAVRRWPRSSPASSSHSISVVVGHLGAERAALGERDREHVALERRDRAGVLVAVLDAVVVGVVVARIEPARATRRGS